MGDVRRLRRWRAMEWASGRLLLAMGRLAKRHGDLHELNHVIAATTMGDSTDCGATCRLRAPRTVRFANDGYERGGHHGS